MGNQSGRAGTNTRNQAVEQVQRRTGATKAQARRAVQQGFEAGAGRGENRAQRRRNAERAAVRRIRQG